MAFSLSPSVDLTEINVSFNTSNLPSSKTGAIIRSDYGEAFKIIPCPDDAELEAQLGKPTNYNYSDWFQMWNFSQYASSGYAVRPIDQAKETKNTAIALSGGSGEDGSEEVLGTYQGVDQSNLYNNDVANFTLPDLVVNSFSNRTIATYTDPADVITPTVLTTLRGLQITQKATTGDDSRILVVNSIDTLQINKTGDTPSYGVQLLDDTVLGGWNIDVGTLELEGGKGASFEVGETITGDTSSAVGTIEAIDTDTLTLSGVVGVFGGDTDCTGSVSGAVAAALVAGTRMILTGFTADATSLIGTLQTVKLVFYNKFTTSVQDIGIAVCSDALSWIENVSSDIANTFQSYFEFAPDWSKNEFAILIFKKNLDNSFTKLEDHIVSYLSTGRDIYNKNIFVEEVLASQSKYLYAKVSSSGGSIVNTGGGALPLLHHSHFNTIYPRTVEGFPATAYDANGYTQGDIDEAFELFADPENFDINLLLAHETSIEKASEISLARKDCFAEVGPFDASELVNKSSATAVTYLTTKFGTVDSSTPVYDVFTTYAAVYGNMKYQYDKYNDVNRWLAVLGDVAGLKALTDSELDPWWAAAGLNRGQIRNVIKLAFNPNKAGRDSLYTNAINPIVSLPGEGAGIVFGQKTSTSVASAFDRINVRRLMLTIEKAIATALRPFMFEFNDEATRNSILGLINPYLSGVVARRGLYDYLVVCDTSNNTAEIIDQNALIVNVFVKPTKVAEFIQVNMVVTKTGASFEEISI